MGNHSLHQVSNDNGCRLTGIATKSKALCFSYKNIHKGTMESTQWPNSMCSLTQNFLTR